MSIWVLLAKGLVAYVGLQLAVRLLRLGGVREAGAWELALLVGAVVLAGFATVSPAVDLTMVAALTILWIGMFLLQRYALIRNTILRRGSDQEPTVLVYRGKLLEHNLYRKRLTTEQLLSKLRARDAFRLMDVELALLEPDGNLSVMRTPQAEPLTKQDMLVSGRDHGLTVPVISEGQVMHENLKRRHLSEKWLRDHLRAFDVEFVSEVALAMVDEQNELYVDKYDDRLKAHRELHPRLTDPAVQNSDDPAVTLGEKPISRPEQIYAEQQLRKTLRENEPSVPKKK